MNMNRRKFLKVATVAGALLPLAATFRSYGFNAAKARKIMVMIQLTGGNDGLNTLIPLNNYGSLMKARPNLFIPENKVLLLDGRSDTGLHPRLRGIRDMYNSGLVSFIQGVGYENQNYSHFRSADIYITGAESSKVLYTGWMARYLETNFKGYPEGFPNRDNPDPPAIKVGDTGTFLFQGKEMDLSIVYGPTMNEKALHSEIATAAAQGYAADSINMIREIMLQTDRYSDRVSAAAMTAFEHSKLYPKTGENPLADQLKMVAKMIHGGLQTEVYHVDLKGFDTHSNQVVPGDTTKGVHADLLHQLDIAITAFWDDITKMKMDKDVSGFAFSEFGRRIISNASYGSDHGASQPIMFFGADIHRGIIGHNPLIPDHPSGSDNLQMQYDFRSVYAMVLRDCFGASESQIRSVLPGDYKFITAPVS
jgi:uncharacterized protein (DUF1501 family)